MSRTTGWNGQRRSQVQIGFAGMAALLGLGALPELAAQPATPEQPAPPTPAASAPAQSESAPTVLPRVTVSTNRPRPTPARNTPARRTTVQAPAVPAQPVTDAPSSDGEQRAGGGTTVGYVATRISTATKTETPPINVPQSVTVLTSNFIKDQNFQSFSEAIRYVPGVVPHQGEFNRDQVVLRGQSSSADFFVNGIRDDVQYFRDFYNIQRVEVLKGPNAMIFGRGGGGGIVNRVLKEADGTPVREITLQGGSFFDKRAAIDLGQAVSPDLAGRINAVYENTDSYRKFVNIERYGVNPQVAFAPNDSTKVALSYEYFHDHRTSDRGIPSQLGTGVILRPFPTDPSIFFGNPAINFAHVDANIATAVIEHDFESGLKIKNNSRYANYDKMYQNVFPGGPVNAAGTTVNLTAYNNETDRQNLFNQTDLTYKINTELVRHTLLAGTELSRQSGLSFRQDGFFANGTQLLPVSALNPVSFDPVTFRNIATGANNTYRLNVAAAYAQDQIEITKYLQLIGGVRFDRFDLDSTDRRTNITVNRIDNLVSPRFGVVVKPGENVSLYGRYSVPYLPSPGGQFS